MQERALQTQARILKAARTVFAHRGFHGAGVDDIARKAGVNKERLYAYFRSKDGLFAAALRDAFAEMVREEVDAVCAIGEEDLGRLTTRLMEHYLDFHATHPECWRLLFWENLEGGRHGSALRGLKEPALEHLRRLYRLGQERGMHDPGVSFETYIFAISAVCFFYFSNRATMSKSLGLNLASAGIRRRLVREIGHVLSRN